MLEPVLTRNDKRANRLIAVVSVVVFVAIAILEQLRLGLTLPFDAHIFAKINAVINTMVSVLLIAGLVLALRKKYVAHKKVMLVAIGLSALFLISYISHHLFAGTTKFGGEGTIKVVYLLLLATHIILAASALPLVLITAYRGLTGDYARHRRIARITYPIWLYVAITGVIVYLMISPYYSV